MLFRSLGAGGLHAFAGHLGVSVLDDTIDEHAQRAEERVRGAQNRDVHRLMGETIARILERDFVTCSKYRKRANEIAEMNVIGDVEGFDVVLVDDLIDTAGTLCKAAEVILQKGAKSVRAFVTHPILSGKAYENINNSVLTELVVCDTIPLKETSPKIKVLSTAKLFARAIRNTHEHKSIEALYDY